ncbi:hypothetical protein ACO0OL_003006 [Hanseniaspora opuntiae]
MNIIDNTIRNQDITKIDPNEINNLATSQTTSNIIKQFISLYKQMPFKLYIDQNILPSQKAKKKGVTPNVLDVCDFTVESEYSFLFQIVMIQDMTKSVLSQVEALQELLTGEVQYADRVAKKKTFPSRKVKQLSEADDIENNGDGDTSVLLDKDLVQGFDSAKDLTLKITLQDKSGAYFYCYTYPDREGILPLVELVNFGCVPLCKKVLGTKIVLRNFTFSRGAIILRRSDQITALAKSSIPLWNDNFYSKIINFWKNSLETRNSAFSNKLDKLEAEQKRVYFQSRA